MYLFGKSSHNLSINDHKGQLNNEIGIKNYISWYDHVVNEMKYYAFNCVYLINTSNA